MLEQGYGIMPNKILFDKDLSDKEKLLFCFISSLCAEKGFCRATNEYIAEKLGVSGRTIREHVSNLNKKGVIIVDMEGNNKRKIRLPRVEENFQEGGRNLPGGEEENFHPYIYMNNTNEYIYENYYGRRKGIDRKKCDKLIEGLLKQGITHEDITNSMVLYNCECAIKQEWKYVNKLENWLKEFEPLNEEQIEEGIREIARTYKSKMNTEPKFADSKPAKFVREELVKTFDEEKLKSIWREEGRKTITLNFK